MADDCPGGDVVTMLAGHVTVGGVLSNTLTAKEQVNPPGVVVQVTVVVPTGKNDPAAGTHIAVQPPAVVAGG
jgi:hypothetical protein